MASIPLKHHDLRENVKFIQVYTTFDAWGHGRITRWFGKITKAPFRVGDMTYVEVDDGTFGTPKLFHVSEVIGDTRDYAVARRAYFDSYRNRKYTRYMTLDKFFVLMDPKSWRKPNFIIVEQRDAA